MDDLVRYRVLTKRFNERLLLFAGSMNTIAIAALGTAILVPMIESKAFSAALTPLNAGIAVWCGLLHLSSYAILGFCKSEEP